MWVAKAFSVNNISKLYMTVLNNHIIDAGGLICTGIRIQMSINPEKEINFDYLDADSDDDIECFPWPTSRTELLFWKVVDAKLLMCFSFRTLSN